MTTNPLFEESKANYAAYREAQRVAQAVAKDQAEAEFQRAMTAINTQIAQLKATRRERTKEYKERELIAAKVRFADASVELLNAGLSKTEFMDSLGSRDWARTKEFLSHASVAGVAPKADRIPAVGYVIDADAKTVTIHPKWKPGNKGPNAPESQGHMAAHGPFVFVVDPSGIEQFLSARTIEWANSDMSDATLKAQATAERKFGNLNKAELRAIGEREFGFSVD